MVLIWVMNMKTPDMTYSMKSPRTATTPEAEEVEGQHDEDDEAATAGSVMTSPKSGVGVRLPQVADR